MRSPLLRGGPGPLVAQSFIAAIDVLTGAVRKAAPSQQDETQYCKCFECRRHELTFRVQCRVTSNATERALFRRGEGTSDGHCIAVAG